MVGGASFAILPGAGRIWKAQRQVVVHVFSPPGPGYISIMESLRLYGAMMEARMAAGIVDKPPQYVPWMKQFLQ